MKLHHIFLGCSLLLAENATGQRAVLFYRSTDIVTAQSESDIRDIWPQKFGKNMRVKHTNGVKSEVPKDSIWGYRNKKGRVFRMYKGEPYQIMENKEYVKYTYETLENYDPFLIPSYQLRYSATLDSPIVYTKKKARRK